MLTMAPFYAKPLVDEGRLGVVNPLLTSEVVFQKHIMYNPRVSYSQFASSQKTRILNSRRKSSSSSTQPTKKRSLPPPTTFPDFCMSLLLYICRQYLLCDLCTKLCIYTIVLLFGSLVHDFLPLPGVYLSRKDNILNIIFVKWSWAWTLVSLGPFIFQTATVLGAGDKKKAWKNLTRLLVGTIVWFVCTNFFVYFGRRTGICSKSHHSDNYHVCIANGGKWRPFDISAYLCL
uniref:Uncharacterized protein n=1 Tax=Romanomermis culicivorax TaxID=13658 RepID=A0A915K040_ROMCU